ncbi:MAG: hypothetical protein ACFFCX_18160, partial [Candidatus Sifarchaeia archaeon]
QSEIERVRERICPLSTEFETTSVSLVYTADSLDRKFLGSRRYFPFSSAFRNQINQQTISSLLYSLYHRTWEISYLE